MSKRNHGGDSSERTPTKLTMDPPVGDITSGTGRLVAHLTEPNGRGVSGQHVTFSYDRGGQVGEATTDPEGKAECRPPSQFSRIFSGVKGMASGVEADFAGSPRYQSSHTSTKVDVGI
ncbi:hypothetical protein [Streptomyces sp. NPDC057702]|uniref:hypothetical protein n=1 Tax=unclassified Streptomyces TaxID=2593676 RepID=UPI0036A08AD3